MSPERPWDAVVVGSGATGGVAAMVLAEAGLRVLVLEAGPELSAARARGAEPLNSLRRLAHLSEGRQQQQAHHPGYWKHNPELFVDERQNPYTTPSGQPFLWTRGRQVGGRSLTWGGITLRLSDYDFQAAAHDGIGPCWPIGYRDLAPYYDRLEQLLGVHGACDGLPQLPDGRYREPLPFTPAEAHLGQVVREQLGLPLIHSRGFALHRPSAAQPWPPSSSQGGCLARAIATGRAALRSGMVVSHVELDPGGQRARGVVMVEASSGRRARLEADLVVLCASTIESVRLLLASAAEQEQGGRIDASGTLGRFLMDHVSCSRFFSFEGPPPPAAPMELSGAGSAFIPNTLNLGAAQDPALRRGYGLWLGIQRFDPPRLFQRRPREAVGFLIGHGEVLPEADNRVRLDPQRTDAWGLPVPHIACRWGPNEEALVVHMQGRMAAVVAAAGGAIAPLEDLFRFPLAEPLLRNSQAVASGATPPGYYIHELGGARMAASPEAGVLNGWNQCWQLPNLLVTDGASWPTSAWQSPTLTSMALTWRACEGALRRRGAAA